jgi:hypothetical protein
MTVDLQIRAVHLDADDQGLAEALGMPQALFNWNEKRYKIGALAANAGKLIEKTREHLRSGQRTNPDDSWFLLAIVAGWGIVGPLSHTSTFFAHKPNYLPEPPAVQPQMPYVLCDALLDSCLSPEIHSTKEESTRNPWPDTCFLARGAVENRKSKADVYKVQTSPTHLGRIFELVTLQTPGRAEKSFRATGLGPNRSESWRKSQSC